MMKQQKYRQKRYLRTGVRCPICSCFSCVLFYFLNSDPAFLNLHTHSQRGPNLFLSYDGHKLNITQKAPFTTLQGTGASESCIPQLAPALFLSTKSAPL